MGSPSSFFHLIIDVLAIASFQFHDYVGALDDRQVHYVSAAWIGICTHDSLVIVQARMQCGMENDIDVDFMFDVNAMVYRIVTLSQPATMVAIFPPKMILRGLTQTSIFSVLGTHLSCPILSIDIAMLCATCPTPRSPAFALMAR